MSRHTNAPEWLCGETHESGRWCDRPIEHEDGVTPYHRSLGLRHGPGAETITWRTGDVPDPITAADLDEIDRLDREATPGPWRTTDGRSTPSAGEALVFAPDASEIALCWPEDESANAAFIARARTLLPRFAAAVRDASAALTAIGHADDSKPLATRIREAHEEAMRHLQLTRGRLERSRAAVLNTNRLICKICGAIDPRDGCFPPDAPAAITRLREDLRLTADALQREIERTTRLEDELARARAVNEQAEKVRDENDVLRKRVEQLNRQIDGLAERGSW